MSTCLCRWVSRTLRPKIDVYYHNYYYDIITYDTRFSRKVIWFTLASTNNDPRVISRYYLEAIEKINGMVLVRTDQYGCTVKYFPCTSLGCPKIVRADLGTENCLVAKVQIALRMHHSDVHAGKQSFIYGPSTANIVSCHLYNVGLMYGLLTLTQRIEAFWSQWRRSVCDWWFSLCKVK